MRLTTLIVVLSLTVTACAGDWPQILGPRRDGIATRESLANAWPDGGPRSVWELKVGSGLAGVAVAGNNVVIYHRVGDEELVEAVAADTGKAIWSESFPTTFVPSINPDNGPRCVPVIDGDYVVVYSPEGQLRCLKLADGKPVWSRATHKDFGANEGYFGAGSSPIVEDGFVIVNVGGRLASAGVVAFDLDNGNTIWKAVADNASYSSPIAVTVGETRHVIVQTRLKTVSLNPKTGGIRWETAFGKTGPTVNGANPIVIGDKLFLTASYRIGALYGAIEASRVTPMWQSDELLSSQYATPIVHDGKLFGVHGRQDVGAPFLRCIDPVTEKLLWSEPLTFERGGHETERGFATLIKADGKLLVWKDDGELLLLKANTKQYQELARVRLFDSDCRPLPALANGRLYVRDTRSLKCVDLRAVKPSK